MVTVIDEVEADLRALIEKDFGPIASGADFRRTLIDWLHYKTRSIPRRPRAVTLSPEVQAQVANYPAIKKIESELKSGGDITPWLSDSVQKKVSDAKADMMFNDWQIIHFHLGDIFVQPKKIQRTSDLLFAFIAADRAIFLDVQPHGSWGMRDLLRILAKVSPSDMSRSELKGVLGVSTNYTDDELVQLRQAGISTTFELDGRFYMSPGLGVATSKHATRIVLAAQRLERETKGLREAIEKNQLPPHLSKELWANLALPVRLGVKFADGQFILYDKNRNLDLMFFHVLE
jgi:hypothetical protein